MMMKSRGSLVLFLAILFLVPIWSGTGAPAVGWKGQGPEMKDIGAQGSDVFIENAGQWDDDLWFIGRTGFGHVGFGTGCVYYDMTRMDGADLSIMEMIRERKVVEQELPDIAGAVVKVSFGGPDGAIPTGIRQTQGVYNFLVGDDESRWVSGARGFDQVIYNDVWDGVDIIFRMDGNGLKYDLISDDKACLEQATFRVEGHTFLAANGDSLTIGTGAGMPLVDSGLSAFYLDGSKEIAPIGFNIIDEDCYGFDLTGMEYGRAVLVDPLITPVFSTYLGGEAYDVSSDIVIDANGNPILCGATMSFMFPTTPGAYQTSLSGLYNCFVTKVSSDAKSIIFSTYLGGSLLEIPYGIVLDPTGSIYLTGFTLSDDFPTTSGAFNETKWGTTDHFDAFITKLNTKASALDYSTYVAGEMDDMAYDIMLDPKNNAFIVGQSDSTEFPVTADAYDQDNNGLEDIFVFGLSWDGSTAFYSTYIGGTDSDYGYSIHLDYPSIYVCGGSWSYDFPVTKGAYQTSLVDWTDVVAFKLDLGIGSLAYSTYIGGDDEEEGQSLDVDADGNAFITGYTWGGTRIVFPTTSGAYSTTFNGGDTDIFALELSNLGDKLVYSTFMGGTSEEYGYKIMLDASNNAYVTGYTLSTDFPTTTTTLDNTLSGETDAVFFKLDKNGANLLFSTYLGGTADETGISLTINDLNEIFLVGETSSKDFPVTSGVIYPTLSGDYDAYLTKLNLSRPPTEPLGLAARVGDDFIEMSWSPPLLDGGSKILHYSLYKGTSMGSETLLIDTPDLLYNDTDVLVGTQYYYKVKAVNAIGEGPFSQTVPAKLTSVSSEPRSLSATPGIEQITLTWQAPGIDGGSPVVTYNIYRGVSGESLALLTSITAIVTTYTDPGLQNGMTYYYAVTAVNAKGESVKSTIVNATVLDVPSPPRALTARSGEKFVLLGWEEPASDGGSPITGYRVYRGETLGEKVKIASLPPESRGFNDSSLDNGKTYYYNVTAMNLVGESRASDDSMGTPMTVPDPPRLLQPMTGDGFVLIRWELPLFDGGSPVIGYRIYTGLDIGPNELLMEFGPDVMEYNHTGLTNGVPRFYTLTCLNLIGESKRSIEITETPLGLPDPPSDIITEPGDGFVRLTWKAPLDTGGLPVASYQVYRASSDGELTLLSTINTLTYNDSKVWNGRTYRYALATMTDRGASQLSPEVIAVPMGVPDPPTNFSVVAGSARVDISWGTPADLGGSALTEYRVYRGILAGQLEPLRTLSALETNMSDTDVQNGVTYYYRMTCANIKGESPQTVMLSAKPMGVPTAPLNLRTSTSGKSIVLTWEPPLSNNGGEITRYNIYRAEGQGDRAFLGHVPGTTTRYTDLTAKVGVNYRYDVTAENSAGEGQPSEVKEVKIEEEGGMSSLGLILGMVFFSLVLLVIVAVVVFLLLRKKKSAAQPTFMPPQVPPGLEPSLLPSSGELQGLPPSYPPPLPPVQYPPGYWQQPAPPLEQYPPQPQAPPLEAVYPPAYPPEAYLQGAQVQEQLPPPVQPEPAPSLPAMEPQLVAPPLQGADQPPPVQEMPQAPQVPGTVPESPQIQPVEAPQPAQTQPNPPIEQTQ